MQLQAYNTTTAAAQMKSFHIKTALDRECFSAHITDVQDFSSDAKFYFYVLRYGVIIDRSSSWSAVPSIEYHLKCSGTYTVQGHVKDSEANIKRQAAPLFYSTAQDKSEFLAYANGETTHAPPPLSVYVPKAPYFNILVDIRSHDSSKSSLDRFDGCPKHQQNSLFTWGTVSTYSDTPSKSAGQTHFLFSGVAKTENPALLRIGQNEVEWPAQVDGAIGSCCLFTADIDRDSFTARTDFFGITKLYYYKSGSRHLLSNNYYLLLKALKPADIHLCFRTDTPEALFAFANVQPFHQAFTDALDIDGIYMLPLDSCIECNASGININCSEIASFLEAPLRLESAEDYHQVLSTACEEVVSNCAVVFDRSDVDYILTDLSGGLDTRMVLAAALRCNVDHSKLRINIRHSPREPTDHIIACSLNTAYHFSYDDLPETHSEPDSWNDTLSFYLGQYYSYTPLKRKQHIKSAIRLVGFFGEITARPYYTRFLFDEFEAIESIDEFAALLLEKFEGLSWIGNVTSISILQSLLAEQLRRLPGQTPLEKYEHLYLFYRNRLHCCDHLRSDYSCLEWGPLQSKTLFCLKRALYAHQRGIQLQLDCIQHLNKALSSHPYQSASDEDARNNAAHSDFALSTGLTTSHVTEPALNEELQKWNRASQLKQSRSSKIASREEKTNLDPWQDALEAMRHLCRHGVISIEIAESLHYIFKEFRNDEKHAQTLTFYNNRLLSLYYQHQAIL